MVSAARPPRKQYSRTRYNQLVRLSSRRRALTRRNNWRSLSDGAAGEQTALDIVPPWGGLAHLSQLHQVFNEIGRNTGSPKALRPAISPLARGPFRLRRPGAATYSCLRWTFALTLRIADVVPTLDLL